MSVEAIVLILSVITAAIIGVPLVWSLVLSSVLSIVVAGEINMLPTLVQTTFAGGFQYALLAIFFFVLSGNIMTHGGLSKRLIDFSDSLIGHVSGGTAIVCVVACAFFAAISGSAVATTAAIGGLMYPELVKRGYPRDHAAALPAATGVLGVIIPPSVLMILYGSINNVSPGKLLMSGMIPGIMGATFIAIICYVYGKKHKIASKEKFNWERVGTTFKKAILSLIMPLIILGGIYLGIFTPTESGVVAAVYSIIVTVVVYRSMSWSTFKSIVIESCKTTGSVMILVMAAGCFSYLLTIYQVPAALSNFVVSNVSSQYTYFAGVVALLLFLGMFMDVGAIILILGPMLAPVARSYGIDPIHFGLIFIFTVAIGQATPPFGTNLFVACGYSGQSVMQIGKKSLIYSSALVLVIILCIVFPQLVTALPNMMGY